MGDARGSGRADIGGAGGVQSDEPTEGGDDNAAGLPEGHGDAGRGMRCVSSSDLPRVHDGVWQRPEVFRHRLSVAGGEAVDDAGERLVGNGARGGRG